MLFRSGQTERTPYTPSGIGHLRRTDTEAATRNDDNIENTTVPAKCRLASAVTASNAMTTREAAGNAITTREAAGNTVTTPEAVGNAMITPEVAGTKAKIGMHLVLANRTTGLDLRENMCHLRTLLMGLARCTFSSIRKGGNSRVTS